MRVDMLQLLLIFSLICEVLTLLSKPIIFETQRQYLDYLKSISGLPKGFKVGTSRFQFKPFEVNKLLPMNLTLIVTDEPTDSFAACLTSNSFPGGPIYVNRDRIKNSKYLQAIVVNNKISNVCPGGVDDFGAGDSELVCSAVAKRLNIDRNSIFPSSTGIIGWKLPVDEIVSNGLGGAVSTLQGDSMYPAALGITTTDRYPKVQYYQSKDRRWSISGIAKGAGMIEPNMATMLSYILTDLSLPREYLQNCLSEIVAQSFNVITVDGDQSTSDTVLLLSSKKVDAISNDDLEFKIALLKICCELAEDIVRNGEGTNHVIKLTVSGAPSAQIARDLGRFVLNSNLLKCAIAGNDPNVGRIVAAIGSYFGKNGLEYLQKGLSIRLGDVEIFSNDQFQLNPTKEAELSDYMLACQLFEGNIPEIERTYPPHFKTVDVCIILDTDSKDQLTLFGSDLTAEYVAINADYRS